MPIETSIQSPSESPSRRRRRFEPAARFVVPALWVGAGVMLGLFVFQGRDSGAQDIIRGMANRANAGMVSHTGSYAALTNEVNNEDMLIVLDQRTESLLVYHTDAKKGIDLQQRVSLPRVFEDARLRAMGNP